MVLQNAWAQPRNHADYEDTSFDVIRELKKSKTSDNIFSRTSKSPKVGKRKYKGVKGSKGSKSPKSYKGTTILTAFQQN